MQYAADNAAKYRKQRCWLFFAFDSKKKTKKHHGRFFFFKTNTMKKLASKP